MICEIHKVEFVKVDPVPCGDTVIRWPDYCPVCSEERDTRIEKERAIEKEVERLAQLYKDVPERYKQAELSQFNNTSILKISDLLNWVDTPKEFFFIFGPCGSGKTHLACAVKKNWNSRGKRTHYTTSIDLVREIKSSFDDKSIQEAEMIRRYSSDVRIFDDVGSEYVTDYIRSVWMAIIDRRYVDMIPTLFVSNLSPAELKEVYSDRIVSRMMTGIVSRLVGGDRRIKTI